MWTLVSQVTITAQDALPTQYTPCPAATEGHSSSLCVHQNLWSWSQSSLEVLMSAEFTGCSTWFLLLPKREIKLAEGEYHILFCKTVTTILAPLHAQGH